MNSHLVVKTWNIINFFINFTKYHFNHHKYGVELVIYWKIFSDDFFDGSCMFNQQHVNIIQNATSPPNIFISILIWCLRGPVSQTHCNELVDYILYWFWWLDSHEIWLDSNIAYHCSLSKTLMLGFVSQNAIQNNLRHRMHPDFIQRTSKWLTHRQTDKHTDTGNDNTRRPKLALGKNKSLL